MASKSKPVPNAPGPLTPYLTVRDAPSAIEFYKKAFGATETMRMAEPSGRIGHAEIQIGGAALMLSDEYPEMDVLGPQSRGGSTAGMQLYVEDVDAVFERAVAAGAKSIRPVADQFYGDRSGKLMDPFGHVWFVSTRKENVSPAEMMKRYETMMKEGA
jgi:PhnB protein